jgi:hypothetical protein
MNLPPPDPRHPARAHQSRWVAAVKAGFAYFAMIFTLAFAMGVLRAMLVAPAVGDEGAVAIELLILLPVSWVAAGFLVRRFRVQGLGPRLAMGALALCLVLSGEAVLALGWLDRSLVQFLNDFRKPGALLGLIGQTIFALMPAVRLITGKVAR